jgi:predicted nuclease with TOPRIM domain
VAELESKGKKISEETKKWIAEIAKLTDKCEELRDKSSLLNKELEGLNHQMTTADKVHPHPL